MTERAKLAIKMGIEVEELKTILKMYKDDLKRKRDKPILRHGICYVYLIQFKSDKFHTFWFLTNRKLSLCPCSYRYEEKDKQLTHPPRIEYLTKLIEEMEK
jgi:hypothetical protein